jgi:hypothetical protein
MLVSSVAKTTIEAIALAALTKEFQGEIPPKELGAAQGQWKKQAAVLAAVAEALVTYVLANAQVAPGIPVLAPPPGGAGVTTAPGKVI